MVREEEKKLPWKLVAVSGASGSGKSTLLQILYKNYGSQIQGVPNVTTRGRRNNDEPFLEYVSKEVFSSLDTENTFAWTKEVHGNFFGIRKTHFKNIFIQEGCSVMIVTPDTHEVLSKTALAEGRSLTEIAFIHVCAPEEAILRERLMLRGDDQASIERRINECKEWDEYVKALPLPIHLLKNEGRVEELEAQVTRHINDTTSRVTSSQE